nr:malonate decarboxylase beta subunit {N-terminal} [Acinetobacter calcoaceticus, Peptide Partial, 15 aa] [Acinetobacter calcoaceticus]
MDLVMLKNSFYEKTA